ncbi:MAG: DUF4062 domain-containing protein [Saccharofermentanales bacterium]
MNQVKYQVFLSSTFKDLNKERKKVLDILLMADCIPAGMEAFVATDEEQFNVIKKVIDLCDYYILIIGRRYGSINESSGISYTEMEYNYAINKGIPVLVFSLDESVEVAEENEESDAIKRGKLAEFRNKAMQNRLASMWTDEADLMGKVAISIMRAKNEIERPGWRRGNRTDNTELLEKIIELQNENESLKEQVKQLELLNSDVNLKDSFYDKDITLRFTEKVYIFSSNTTIDKQTITIKLSELFKFVSLRVTGINPLNTFIDEISAYKSGYTVNKQDALKVRNRFENLNLIKSFVDSDGIEKIELTDFGKNMMNKLNDE